MFYKTGVDISSPKSMWEFLHDHFTYFTLNSWNGCKSIANNMKMYNLKLEGDWGTALRFFTDEADMGDAQFLVQSLISEFERSHYFYRVFSNGRSGGYLVLYNRDNNTSVLPYWITDYDTYEDFKADVKECCNSSVSDYKQQLRIYTQLVREFDELCDRLRDLANDYSLMSFEDQMLAETIDRFNDEYSSDLKFLGFKKLKVNADGKVDVQEVQTLSCLMETLLHYFASSNVEVEVEDGFLYVEV